MAPTVTVRINWSEAGVTEPTEWMSVEDFDRAVSRLACTAPKGGAYAKTSITVRVGDDEVLQTRLDVHHPTYAAPRPLRAWLRDEQCDYSSAPAMRGYITAIRRVLNAI